MRWSIPAAAASHLPAANGEQGSPREEEGVGEGASRVSAGESARRRGPGRPRLALPCLLGQRVDPPRE